MCYKNDMLPNPDVDCDGIGGETATCTSGSCSGATGKCSMSYLDCVTDADCRKSYDGEHNPDSTDTCAEGHPLRKHGEFF